MMRLNQYEKEVVTACWDRQIYIFPKPIQGSGNHWATPDVRLRYHIGVDRINGKKIFKQNTKRSRELLYKTIQKAYEHYYNKIKDGSFN